MVDVFKKKGNKDVDNQNVMIKIRLLFNSLNCFYIHKMPLGSSIIRFGEVQVTLNSPQSSHHALQDQQIFITPFAPLLLYFHSFCLKHTLSLDVCTYAMKTSKKKKSPNHFFFSDLFFYFSNEFENSSICIYASCISRC